MDTIELNRTKIEELYFKVAYDEKDRLDSTLGGMTYAEGIRDALDFILGEMTEEELLNE